MVIQEQHTWLNGRVLLMGEIGGRVQALRSAIDRRGVSQGFRAGLVLFLERRLEHLGEVIVALQASPHSDPARQQSLDRMLAAVVGTLRHVELEISIDMGRNADWAPVPAPDRRLVSARRGDAGSLAGSAVSHHEGH